MKQQSKNKKNTGFRKYYFRISKNYILFVSVRNIFIIILCHFLLVQSIQTLTAHKVPWVVPLGWALCKGLTNITALNHQIFQKNHRYFSNLFMLCFKAQALVFENSTNVKTQPKKKGITNKIK